MAGARERPVLGLSCSAAGGVEGVRAGLVEPLLAAGWTVTVTATPAAAAWLADLGEDRRLEEVTGHPVRSTPRLPREPRPHPDPDVRLVAPATAGTVAKLALGLADNQALTPVCEAIGGGEVPVVVFPCVNAWHAGHPAWQGHLAALRSAGVHLVYGGDVWPLRRPGAAPVDLPWGAVLRAVQAAAPST
ncbi:flavoprotein [Kineococcus sp. NUM-3379]